MAIADQVIDRIMDELGKAEAKFPGWPDDVVHGAAILGEEAGELLQAALDHHYGREPGVEPMLKEAAQTGAMAIRFMTDLLKRMEQEERYLAEELKRTWQEP